MLKKRKLGQTGLEVSCLGLGTVKFGRNFEVKYPERFSLPSDLEIERLLARARELGLNLLDTAPAYGSSEQRLGRLLRNRQDWILATKVGEEFVGGISQYHFNAEHINMSVERSLRDLRTDYLDIVLIHSDGRDCQVLDQTDCVETLERLKEKGLVRATGISTKTIAGGRRAAELMDVVMVSLNLDYREEAEVVDNALDRNRGVLIKKALGSGHSNDPGKSLQYAVNYPGVSSVIVGTINPAHLAANVGVISDPAPD